jgi:hypothetical protein
MTMKDMLNDWRRWMAKTTMPLGRRLMDDAESLLNWGCTNGIQATLTLTTNDDFPRIPVLHKNIIWMKLNKNIIIKSEFLNRQEITSNFRNMKDILR